MKIREVGSRCVPRARNKLEHQAADLHRGARQLWRIKTANLRIEGIPCRLELLTSELMDETV